VEAAKMAQRTLAAFSDPFFQRVFQQTAGPEIAHIRRILGDDRSNTPTAEYLLIDRFNTVLEVRDMSPKEAQDANQELLSLGKTLQWLPLSEMGD
jgi:hypothetical protein